MPGGGMSGATTLKDSTTDLPGQAGAGPAPLEKPPGPPGTTHPTSIAEFLTDGSLPALCAELSRLTGVAVELRDGQGRLIVIGTGQPGPGAWRVVDDGRGIPSGDAAIPLRLGSVPIGWIVLGEGRPAMASDSRERLESALALLVRTATELCQHEVELRHR